MRLLRLEELGVFSLVEFMGSNIPPYAILFHTWGPDEVTFRDIIAATATNKEGYHKLKFCARQAAKDGLQYFWVDTCCIDKSSSSELSEAVNSLFRWYRDAKRCYVHLSDVNIGKPIEFRSSRWFTRGWTLQELLAPNYVEFFSMEGERLGDRLSLIEEIAEVTRIPLRALRGEPLSHFSVEERWSWTKGRHTAREEDMAYCMMGIFDVHLPIIYGEGGTSAIRRLLEEIERSCSGEAPPRQTYDVLFPKSSSRDARAPNISETLLSPNSDSDSDVASIFSDGRLSSSSTSSVSQNPVQTIGVREVSRALLGQEDLRTLYTIAVRSLERQKARTHIRGFLKEYGRNLQIEAGQSKIQAQAAKFVQELAGRIADEINLSITRLDLDLDQPSLALPATTARKDLEHWLSALEPKSTPEPPEASVEDVFEDFDSDEELDHGPDFPHIGMVMDFLLESRAYKVLVKSMQIWLKVKNHRREHNKMEKGKDLSFGVNTTADSSESPVTDDVNKDMAQKRIDISQEHKAQASESTHQQVTGDSTSHSTVSGEDHVDQRSQHDLPMRAEHDQSLFEKHSNIHDLVTGLLQYWGISFFFYDLVDILLPRVPQGYTRTRWRCSCNTVLWGDFPTNEEQALNCLKRDMAWWKSIYANQRSSRNIVTPLPGGGPGSTDVETNSGSPIESVVLPTKPLSFRPVAPTICAPQSTSNTAVASASHIVDINIQSKYMELCINIGNFAIDHHEIDISDVDSDGELFGRIWDKYNSSRGYGLRRLFLRPRDVHFVMFSVSRRTKYGAGIHEKPNVFPPQVELDLKRYHYLCPQIRMPVNVFLHYLHRARWNVWGEHTEDIWLRRLPKKLSQSVLVAVQQNAAVSQQSGLSDADPDLAFGWGVHILHGPNHAVLGLLLCVGVTISFVASGFVVGFAKTQEQGFGVGAFLLAIMANLMAAVYFKLQDQ